MLIFVGMVILVIAELNDFSRAYRTPAGPIVLRTTARRDADH